MWLHRAVPAQEGHCYLAVAWREEGWVAPKPLERERADSLKR